MNLFVKVVYGIRITYISCPLEFYINSDLASCVFEKIEPDYYIFRTHDKDKDDVIIDYSKGYRKYNVWVSFCFPWVFHKRMTDKLIRKALGHLPTGTALFENFYNYDEPGTYYIEDRIIEINPEMIMLPSVWWPKNNIDLGTITYLRNIYYATICEKKSRDV